MDELDEVVTVEALRSYKHVLEVKNQAVQANSNALSTCIQRYLQLHQTIQDEWLPRAHQL